MSLKHELIELEMSRQPAEIQQRYAELVKAGNLPEFAAMLAMRQAPGTLESDRTFNQARLRNMNRMSDSARDGYVQMARKAGVSTQGKFYVGALGRPNDPSAWVSTVDDAKAVLKAKNLNSEGLVTNKAVPVPPPERKKQLAPDIVSELVSQELKKPETREKVRKKSTYLKELAESVVEKHAYSNRSNGQAAPPPLETS